MDDSDAGPSRAPRTVFIGACVLAAFTAGVIALVSVLTTGTPIRGASIRPVSPAQTAADSAALAAAAAERAKIYAAVLQQQDLGQRYVIERECGDIGARPNYRCTGQSFDLRMQQAVRALTGPNVQFGPPRESLLGGFHGVIVGFGPLALTGGRARLAMEVYDGPECSTGATYLLARRGAAWLVTGTVGPQWIS